MHRRKVSLAAAAVFALGVAVAAQPTSLRADWGKSRPLTQTPWAPGTNELMSAHEPRVDLLLPPR